MLGILGLELSELCLDVDLLANPSLGLAEAELVRRLNPELQQTFGTSYGPLVREVLAERVLNKRASGPPIVLPGAYEGWVEKRSAEIVAQLRAADYNVVGDLHELLDGGPGAGQDIPSNLPESELAPAAYFAILGLLKQIGVLRGRVDRLRAQQDGLAPPDPPGPTGHGQHGTGPAFRMADGQAHDADHATEVADAGPPSA